MDLLEASKIKNFKISRKKVTMVSDCSIFHVRPGQTSLPPADHLLPPQTASCQLRGGSRQYAMLGGTVCRLPLWHTSTLWLNGSTLWLWLTLRGALHPCLLCRAPASSPVCRCAHRSSAHRLEVSVPGCTLCTPK